MKKDVSIIYRDIVIELQDNKFQIDGEDWSKRYDNLVQACEAIDRQLDVPFERVNVFWESYGGEMFKGVATSISDSGEVWVSHPDKKGQWRQREKVSQTVFVDNTDNQDKYLKITEIRKELKTIAEEYRNKVEEIKKTMQILNPKPVKE